MASIAKRANGQWRARYRDADGREHAQHFPRKSDAQRWLDRETAKLATGSWVSPAAAKVTVAQWCATWQEGYGTRKPSTVRMAQVHVAKIVAAFGPRRLDSIKPSDINAWMVQLQREGFAPSYVYALHSRLAQVMTDAVHDGVLARSPASRRTSPKVGAQRPYVATTQQVWQLHDAMGERFRPGLLLAAFSGLRLAEVCGLRVRDIDFMRGVVAPVQQYPAEPLKTDMSMTAIPIPASLALTLSAHVAEHPSEWLLSDPFGAQMGPWQLQREFRAARAQVKGLPEGFRFHDLRHYYASLLISSGLDVKVVQTRMRHTSAKTTLDVYSHLWPDSDDSTRAAIGDVMATRAGSIADSLRTERRHGQRNA